MEYKDLIPGQLYWNTKHGAMKFLYTEVGKERLHYFTTCTAEDKPDFYTDDTGLVDIFKNKPDNATAGMKFDGGKPRFELIPMEALMEEMKVLTSGAEKYNPDNWKYVKGRVWRYVGAAGRHIMYWWIAYMAWWMTKDDKYRQRGKHKHDISMIDFESGISHMAHLACCAHFLTDCELHPGEDEMEGYHTKK